MSITRLVLSNHRSCVRSRAWHNHTAWLLDKARARLQCRAISNLTKAHGLINDFLAIGRLQVWLRGGSNGGATSTIAILGRLGMLQVEIVAGWGLIAQVV